MSTNINITNTCGGGAGGGGGLGPALLGLVIVAGVVSVAGAVASMVTAVMVAVASILTAAIWGATAIVCVGIAAKATVIIHGQRVDMAMARNAQTAALERARLSIPVHRPVVIDSAPTRKAIRR